MTKGDLIFWTIFLLIVSLFIYGIIYFFVDFTENINECKKLQNVSHDLDINTKILDNGTACCLSVREITEEGLYTESKNCVRMK